MRPIVLSICLLATACGSQGPKSPASPTAVPPGLETSQGQGGNNLPFSGTVAGTADAAFPAPGTLEITLDGAGHATLIGKHEMHSVSTGTFPEPVATGQWVFTAADGSQLFAEIEARGEPIGEFTDRVTNLGKITGGTGRFASATGQFTAVLIATRDESTRTGTFSGSFEGRLNLNR